MPKVSFRRSNSRYEYARPSINWDPCQFTSVSFSLVSVLTARTARNNNSPLLTGANANRTNTNNYFEAIESFSKAVTDTFCFDINIHRITIITPFDKLQILQARIQLLHIRKRIRNTTQ